MKKPQQVQKLNKIRRYSLVTVMAVTLSVLLVLAGSIFSMMYFKLGSEHRAAIISVCVVGPVLVSSLLFVFLCLRYKLEKPKEENAFSDPTIQVCETFALKFGAHANKFGLKFALFKEAHLPQPPAMRLFILIETLSLVKPLMVSMPDLINEKTLENMSQAVTQLE
jgi:hypothetical protein